MLAAEGEHLLGFRGPPMSEGKVCGVEDEAENSDRYRLRRRTHLHQGAVRRLLEKRAEQRARR